MRRWFAIAFGISVIFMGGCASDHSPRPAKPSNQKIGVIVPPGSNEFHGAGDFLQLNNHAAVSDRVKNSAIGAGAGAAGGAAIGGTAALIGCGLSGPWVPVCWAILATYGVVIGGGTGAVVGAVSDTQENVAVSPAHRYKMNQVLTALQRESLSNANLQQRALRLLRLQVSDINFIPAEQEGDRYRWITQESTGASYSDVTLVLSDLRVQLEGKAENDPKVALSIYAQWSLRKYDAETELNPDWGVREGKYQSKRYKLSEWLADDGTLLKSHLDTGLESSFNSAFRALAPESEEQKWARIAPEDST